MKIIQYGSLYLLLLTSSSFAQNNTFTEPKKLPKLEEVLKFEGQYASEGCTNFPESIEIVVVEDTQYPTYIFNFYDLGQEKKSLFMQVTLGSHSKSAGNSNITSITQLKNNYISVNHTVVESNSDKGYIQDIGIKTLSNHQLDMSFSRTYLNNDQTEQQNGHEKCSYKKI